MMHIPSLLGLVISEIEQHYLQILNKGLMTEFVY